LVKRDFAATRPNALWVADFTYLRCWEGDRVLQLRDRRVLEDDRRLVTVAMESSP